MQSPGLRRAPARCVVLVQAMKVRTTMRSILALVLILAGSSPGAAGTIGTDDRLPIAEYAKQHEMDILSARKLFGASGRIKCPSYAATAFLVHRSDIVMTARHVVVPGPNYADWKPPDHCAFEVSEDGVTSTWYDVDTTTIVYPMERLRSGSDRFDWIAMRLKEPIPDVVPYRLPALPAAVNDDITAITLSQDGLPFHAWNERIVEDCNVRGIVDLDEIPGSVLKIDCSATRGASGGALVRQGADGLELVGVLTATTNSCNEYSPLWCFSFAVGMSEDIKQAIRALVGEQ
jgi:hypothetical protein